MQITNPGYHFTQKLPTEPNVVATPSSPATNAWAYSDPAPSSSGADQAEHSREKRGFKFKGLKSKLPARAPARLPAKTPVKIPPRATQQPAVPGTDSVAGSAIKGVVQGAGSTVGTEATEKLKEWVIGKTPSAPEAVQPAEPAAPAAQEGTEKPEQTAQA